MSNGRVFARLTVSAVCLLVLFNPAGAWLASQPTSTAASPEQAYPSSSWALGVVIPEGAALAGGGKLAWEGVENITTEFTLPNISMPEGIVYVVASVMTSTGAVLQAAVGIRPGDTTWFAYSWSIPNAESIPLIYSWVLNGTEPELGPGSNVTVSIFQASGVWNARIEDMGTEVSVVHPLPDGKGSSLKAGDQEVFSLESYSRSAGTFQQMGNLTLGGVWADEVKVVGGAYTYGEWDPTHSPLFVVGSSGSSPPSFISIGQAKDGSFIWGYDEVWGNRGDSLLPAVMSLLVIVLPIVVVFGLAFWKTKRSPNGTGLGRRRSRVSSGLWSPSKSCSTASVPRGNPRLRGYRS